PQQWRPKITAIEEAKDLKKLSLESRISNLRSHEMVLNADGPLKNFKSVALQSTKTSSKSLKAKLVEIEEESSIDGQEDELEDEDFALFTRKFQQWEKLNKKNFKGNGSRNSGYKDKKD
ncbi:serine/threonine protein kinase SRPK1, partial [Trifolium medium]|nr:serine/threonine protein kinase SRPK1 [Trifolium medium]